ncbi:MAG: RidA family protein [Alphaproteobacteria bacterium]|nr:RidA family protein [Alphaproteobacteria bacterium]
MSKRRITHPQVGEPPEDTWSNCLVIDGHVYIAGMTARGKDFDGAIGSTDAYGQAVEIFTKIKNLMEAAGGGMDDVVKVLIYLTDINDRDAVWKARREFFTGNYPVSTLIEVSKLVRPELCVEIEAVGMLGAAPGSSYGIDDSP